MRRRPLLPVCMAFTANAQQQVTTTYYRLSTGTGFLVNDGGDVVTNAHVVRGCKSISVLTPRGEESAQLLAADAERDLAVLKTPYLSKNFAPLLENAADLAVGDPVVVMGYPGAEGAAGRERYQKTRVTAQRGPVGEERLIQLASVAARGNSGGPVLDQHGNVVAVITGIATTYRVGADGALTGNAIGQSDVAITLPALQDFLRNNGIGFYGARSNRIIYGDSTLHDRGRGFILPVRCVLDVSTTPPNTH